MMNITMAMESMTEACGVILYCLRLYFDRSNLGAEGSW